jgi:ABC-type antimicrobial peptide transport system permease subunit
MAAKLNSALGKDSSKIQIKTPIYTTYKKYANIKEMTDSIVTLQIIFFAILSSVVIYSLIAADVEQQTYQFAMLRALGLKKCNLIGLMIL